MEPRVSVWFVQTYRYQAIKVEDDRKMTVECDSFPTSAGTKLTCRRAKML